MKKNYILEILFFPWYIFFFDLILNENSHVETTSIIPAGERIDRRDRLTPMNGISVLLENFFEKIRNFSVTHYCIYQDGSH